jgi:flagellar hook-length control protein FliK
MADLNNLLIKTPPATGSAEKLGTAVSAEKGMFNSDGNPSASSGLFATIFKTSVEQSAAAKSGNTLPKSGDSAQLDSVSSGAELKSRQLKSGLQIIVGGAEPSTEGLDAFARAQGIDSRALADLMSDSAPGVKAATVELPKDALENSEAIAAWLSDTTVTDIVARHAVKVGAESAKPIPQVALFQEMPAKFSAQVSAPSLQLTPATQSSAADFGVSAQQIAEAIRHQAKAGSAPTLNAEMAEKLILPTHQHAQNKAEMAEKLILPTHQHAQNKAEMAEKLILPTHQHAQNKAEMAEKLILPAQPRSQNETPTAQKLLAAIERQQLPQSVMTKNPGLLGSRQNQNTASIVEKLTLKSVAVKTLTDNFNKLSSGQQQPSIKLEVIDLTRSALNTGLEKKAQDSALLASGAATPAAQLSITAPLLTAAPTSVAFSEAAFTASQQNSFGSADKVTADTLPEQLQQQALQKQEEHSEMSRRLAEALGQRLTAQIARGAWRVEMDLHPKSLGRIEIQLEMKNGELEANFVAANAATRELLNESMPRLRVALEEHGMETAYIGLGQGNQGNSDGKSTGQNKPDNGAVTLDGTEIEPGDIGRQLSNDGLDVLV